MHIDVFKGDLFSLTTLSKAIIDLPFTPTLFHSSGMFESQPVSTTTIEIERVGETLTLVPNAPRGAPGQPVVMNKRSARKFETFHLPQIVTVRADEVQNLRAFGTESEEETALALLTRKLAVARRRLDLTQEWQKVGVVKGQILDADGTTVLFDLFTEFGVTQQTLAMDLDVDGTKVLTKCLDLKRMIEDELGGYMYSGITVYCGRLFFNALVEHPAVVEAYRRYNESSFLRSDSRKGFEFAEITWKEYRGKIGSTPFIGDNDAYAVPEGVPDQFASCYAPADYISTVNTPGLPYYASLEMMDHNKGVEAEVQSNPLHFCTRPRSNVKLTLT